MTHNRLHRLFRLGTRISVVASTRRYRELAASEPRSGDTVLEIGCSTGAATELLARRAQQVVAVDVSAEMVDRLNAEFSDRNHVKAERLDGRDVGALRTLCPSPDLVFLDVGGNALLQNVTAVLRGLLAIYSPRLLVVRSQELAALHSLIVEFEIEDRAQDEPVVEEPELDLLLELAQSDLVADRVFAARKLRSLDVAEAQEKLAELQADPNAQVRWMAYRSNEEPN